ncbi:MAG: cadherin-like domain-containing protein [Paracoccaceae bacterium]
MPIYIESKGIAFPENTAARHEYLVYIPIGQEENYDAWLTIGAFPEDGPSYLGTGTGAPLEATFVNVPLSESYDEWLVGDFDEDLGLTVAEYVAQGFADEAAGMRRREIVYSGDNEAAELSVWSKLGTAANERSFLFTYKAVDIPLGDVVWGPTTNSNSMITSILRTVAVANPSIDIENFETDLNEPGNQNWLGTSSADVLDASIIFAPGDQVFALHGGKGADLLTNEAGSHDVVIIAGDDFDVDDVRGGTGDDVLVGYYNQADLSSSDLFKGGSGDDIILVVDPEITLLGGIPDLDAEPGSSSTDFTLDGEVVGSGGAVDGGDDFDILSYQYAGNPVHLVMDGVQIQNVERISLSHLTSDTVYVTGVQPGHEVTIFGGLSQGSGRLGSDTLTVSDLGTGVEIFSQAGAGRFGSYTFIKDENPGGGSINLYDFEIFNLGIYDDATNYHLFDEFGQDVENIRLVAFNGDGTDNIVGSAAHDELHAGLGNDEVQGGEGADLLYDNGAVRSFQEGDDATAYVNSILAYDTDGNDTIDGGAGSDVFLHSGGTDIFTGGAGHDTYLTVAEVHGSSNSQDHLTIVLSEDEADPETWFGNDLILGDGRGVDKVRLEGINSSDVTISYSYEEFFIGETVAEFTPAFWWTFDFEPATYEHYQTVGAYEIKVNATGSSIVIENVFGTHVRGDNPSPLGGIEASMSVPFTVEFDDGFMSWPDNVLDASNNFYTFENSDLGEDAFAARDALEIERAEVVETIEGDATDEELYGYNSTDLINAGAGDDRVFTGDGDDILIGGSGGDALSGGKGTDTASYQTAASGVGAYLDPERFTITIEYGDADGDTFDSIENLTGSAFNDNLNGDEAANLIEGGAGNDTIRGLGGLDTLMGGAGNDSIRAGEYVDDGGNLFISDVDLYGGDGDDTIRSSSGNDFISGGDGDDLIELSNFVNFQSPGTPGNDVIDGGEGLDTVHFINGGVVVDLGAGTGKYVGSTEEVTLIDVEGVIGSREDDLIIGGGEDNVLIGDGGDDTLVGGGGSDQLYADTFSYRDDAVIFGGSGIDTAHVLWSQTGVTIELIEGGLKINNASSSGSYTIHDDVEVIQFSDGQSTFQDLAAGLITEFAVIDDYIRVDEGTTVTLDVLANDLEFDGNAITIEMVNGVATTPGATIRLDSGATIVVESDGSLTLDQGGAYAWLDANESALTELTYTASDFTGVSRTATSTLVVDGVDTETNQIHLDRGVYITETNPDAADALRIGNFDVSRTILIVDEQYIDPNDVPAGYSVEEINGDTFITYGGDDAVVLNDVALDTWQYAVANQTTGTSASETINGTDGNDAIQAGAGNDRVLAGAGDDVVVGGTGNDDLEFNAGDNIALGGSGNDTLDGFNSGSNLFYGGADNDRLIGGDGNDTLNGGSGDDLLQGIDGDDTLFGDAGDDSLHGGDGIDHFDGGDGFDLLELQNEYPGSFPPGLIVNMRLGYFGWSDFSYGIETFENIEKIVGASGDDLMTGNDVGIWLDGVGGDDTLIGGSGNDTLTDGSDNNEAYGGDGDDFINLASFGNDLFDGGAGNDTLYSGGSFAGDPGHRGNDTFLGGDGIDNLRLAFGYGSTAIDLTLGSMQTGVYTSVVSGIENVETGSGNDTILGDIQDNVLLGNNGNDFLSGGDGDDTLDGGLGNDTHEGGAGNDLLIGNSGGDFHDGGTGNDTLDFTYYDGDVIFDLVQGITDFVGFGSGQIVNLENIIAGGGDDTLTGDSNDNRLDGGVGNDVYNYNLGGGNDTIADSDGVGVLDLATFATTDVTFADGGNGHLEINFSDGAVLTVENQLSGGGLTTIAFSGETLDAAGISAKLSLDAGANTAPDAMDDVATLFANDTALIDVLANDSDADSDALTVTNVVGAVSGVAIVEANQVRFTPNVGFVGVETLTYTVSDGNGGTSTATIEVTIDPTPGEVINGTNDDDNLTGNAGDDTISGAGGEDLINGGAGDDIISGGTHYDTINGGAGDDQIQGDNGRDLVDLGDGNDLFTDNTQTGTHSHDTVDGGAGDDTILGGGGDEVITGGTGNDLLTGGGNSDRFLFAAGDGSDTITDFDLSADTIEIDGVALTPGALPTGIMAIADGSDVLLSYGSGDEIRLTGATLSDWDGSEPVGQVINGTNDDDNLTGNAGDDTISGAGGKDLINGDDGDDIISGGTHYDTINGGAGDDQIRGDNGRDLVDLGDGNDLFTDNTQTGTHGHDTVDGGAGDDTILGGGGDEVITGGTGNDLLTGGGNSDRFLFAAGDGLDTITDFDLSADTIEIDGVALTPGALPAGITATADGSDVLLSYGSSDEIRLTGATLSDWANVNQSVGEVGRVTLAQTGPDQWHSVSFADSIENAVVVMGPVTTNDGDPVTTRVRNITDDGFEFQFDEYEYLDGIHAAETVGWLAVSEGTHTLSNGTTIVADIASVGTSVGAVSFGQSLTDAVVLHQVSSVNDSDAVTSRVDNVDGTGFDAVLREQEEGTTHVAENLSWIAIETGSSSGMEVSRSGDIVGHAPDSFVFNETFATAPILLGNIQTLDGGDTSTLRVDAFSATGFSAYVDEEQSRDSEINHTNEIIGWVALDEGFIL